MSAIPALTVWQPWATLIAEGLKPYEFRGWIPPQAYVGRRIAIHAGKRPVDPDEVRDLIDRLQGDEPWTTALRDGSIRLLEQVLASPGMLPRAHVVCTTVLGVPKRGFDIAHEFGASLNDSDRAQHCQWAWPLTEIHRLEPPIPARGAQGFWRWQDEGRLL